MDKIKERSDIPTEFRRGVHPVAKNVGELADILARLPRNLSLCINCDDYIEVIVPSVNGRSVFVCSISGADAQQYSERHRPAVMTTPHHGGCGHDD